MNHSAYIPVWDPLLRLLHWTMVITFSLCYFTQEQNYELHLLSGYVLLSAIALRIIWGFVGPRYARFSGFIYSPLVLFHHLKELLKLRSRRYLGHNPAGGAMTITLLLALIIITFSGIALDAAENRAGPLADSKLFHYLSYIQTSHDIITDITVVLVIIHLLGVGVQSWLNKENLVRAMISGKKRKHDNETGL